MNNKKICRKQMRQSSKYTITEMQLFVDWKMLARLWSKADRVTDWCSKYLLQFYIYPTQKWEGEENRSPHFISILLNTRIPYQKVNFWMLPAFKTATAVRAINYLIKWTHLSLCSSLAMDWIFKIIPTLTKFPQFLPMHIPHSPFPSQVKTS